MPSSSVDRPSTIPWPPIIYGAALAGAWLLETWLPLPSLPESLLVRWIGAAVFLTGLGVGLAGFMALRAVGTTFDPTGAADALATEGLYAYTRNPLYLAALIGFFGLGLALRSTWLLVAVPAVSFALIKLAIEPEEAYLERRFGQTYRNYAARVRRWI